MLIRPSTVADLARAHLAGEAVLHDRLDTALRDRAIASLGVGCDHTAGEQLLAVIDDSVHPHVFLGAILTDRRYAWRNMQSSGSIEWEDVERVEVTEGLLVAQQHCVLHDGTRRTVPPAGADLSPFFRALSQIPRGRRSTPPAPLSQSSHRDPTGARMANAAMHRCDPRHAALYQLVWHLHEGSDRAADVARDMTARVTGLHRTVCQGRGATGGWWLSPLSPTDLRHALESFLGGAVWISLQGDLAVVDHDIPAELRRDSELRVKAVQRDALVRAGFGRDVARVRVTMRAISGGAAFVVQGWDGEGHTLDRLNPTLLAMLHRQLLEVEHRTVLRRVLAGYEASVEEMWGQPLPSLAKARAVDVAPLAELGLS
ncbi:MAG: hypothetical protein RIF41_25810 [Polyangiaceae bacterium]